MTTDADVIVGLSDIQNLTDLNEFVDDEYVSEAIELVVNMLNKPVPHRLVGASIMKCSALATYFETQYIVYMTIKQGKAGTDENRKKNIYKALAGRFDQMAQDLKYLARDYE